MTSWVVVPDLLSLRAEFDQLAPHRDRGADGTIGDTAHKARSSDHNPDDTAGSKVPHSDTDKIPEVHALDVDSTGPWPEGMTMARSFNLLRLKMMGMGTRAPLAFLIFDRQIAEYPSWKIGPYDGTDPHTGHLHASSRYGSGATVSNPETYSGPWGLLEAFTVATHDPLDTADTVKVWKADVVPNPSFRDDSPRHTPPGTNDAINAAGAIGDIWERVGRLQAQLELVQAQLGEILAAVTAPPPPAP